MEEKDPLARFLVARLKLTPLRAALVAMALGLFYLFLPATFGFLRTTAPGQLGSLDDWHSQVLLLFVAPAIWYFYFWQPQALSTAVGFAVKTPRALPIVLGSAAVLFDLMEVPAYYGRLWAMANPLMIALREVAVLVTGYMLAALALHHLLLAVATRSHTLKRTNEYLLERYSLSAVLLWAILGTRLSTEVIELPARAGSITPDFYFKVGAYILLALLIFFAPLPRPPGAAVMARLLAIVFIPAAFLLLFWILGLEPQFAF